MVKIVDVFRVKVFGKEVSWIPSKDCSTVLELKKLILTDLDETKYNKDLLIVSYKHTPLLDSTSFSDSIPFGSLLLIQKKYRGNQDAP